MDKSSFCRTDSEFGNGVMMANWHGYFVVERQSISIENWDALIALFEAMGQHDTSFPMYNNHWRARLDGDAVIYESNFDTTEVSVEAFKQLLADEFGVDVADIEDEQSIVVYGDYETNVWQFIYPIAGQDRFKVERFGHGGDWEVSRNECLGYLSLFHNEWDEGTQ